MHFVMALLLLGLVTSLSIETLAQSKESASGNDSDLQTCDNISDNFGDNVCYENKYQPKSEIYLNRASQHNVPHSATISVTKEQSFKTVVVSKTRGRLGNHLWSYMWLMFVELKYNIEIFVENEVKSSLTKLFENFENQKTVDDACGYNEFFSQFRDVIDEMMIRWYEEKSGRNVTFTRKAQTAIIDPPEVALQYGILNFETFADSREFIQKFEADYSKFPPNCLYKVTLFLL